MMDFDQLTNAATIGLVLIAWRAIAAPLAALSHTVADIDRRLARVEGVLSVTNPDATD